jgi:hypothetical protein
VNLSAAHWEALDRHFFHQAQQLDRFRHAGRDAVCSMWASQTNEHGEPLSQFEREALIERHCQLFGTWPQLEPQTRPSQALKAISVSAATISVRLHAISKLSKKPGVYGAKV